MNDNPYQSPLTPHERVVKSSNGNRWLLASFAAFLGGLPCGLIAVFLGAVHTFGLAWPTYLFSAPVYLIASYVVGDNIGYVYTMILGTGLLYALYAYLLSVLPRWRGAMIVIALHVSAAVIANFL